jgi:hypothetical protein
MQLNIEEIVTFLVNSKVIADNDADFFILLYRVCIIILYMPFLVISYSSTHIIHNKE